MRADDLTNLLAFVTYVAAARADATPEQAAELRRTVLPALAYYRAGEIEEEDVLREVNAAMGPEWNPSVSWADQLDALGFTRDSAGHTH